MNKCDDCVKDIDTCNICTYNIEKTYGRESSNIVDYGVMSDYDEDNFVGGYFNFVTDEYEY